MRIAPVGALALHVALLALPAPALVPNSPDAALERPQVVHRRRAMSAPPGWVTPPPVAQAPSAAWLGASRAALTIAEAQEAALEIARAAVRETARAAAAQAAEASRPAALAGVSRPAAESPSTQAALASPAPRARVMAPAGMLVRPAFAAEYVRPDVSGSGSAMGRGGDVPTAVAGAAGVMNAEAQAVMDSASRVDLLRSVAEQVRGMPAQFQAPLPSLPPPCPTAGVGKFARACRPRAHNPHHQRLL
jgi:hypothetical protein